MRNSGILLLIAAGCGGVLPAADFPTAEIANGVIQAKFYLPDAEKGYYRGTRFDWSGSIYSLQYKGHNFFGQWFDRYDPKIHDAITGPVEEFRTGDSAPGYEEAQPGGTFIRIGVGEVRKPAEDKYRTFGTYEIVNPGFWRVTPAADRITFSHELSTRLGYSYLYTKTVRLEAGKPVMVIEHSLKNTGRRPIETSQYNHNFFVLDGEPSGPDFTVTFPFVLRSAVDRLNGLAELRRNQVVFLKTLSGNQNVFTEMRGFRDTVLDYDILVQNRKTGTAVHILGDRPLSKLVFWSNPRTVCPEPYIQMSVEPGGEFHWRYTYEFRAGN